MRDPAASSLEALFSARTRCRSKRKMKNVNLLRVPKRHIEQASRLLFRKPTAASVLQLKAAALRLLKTVSFRGAFGVR
jgi:hypothetical protein